MQQSQNEKEIKGKGSLSGEKSHHLTDGESSNVKRIKTQLILQRRSF